MVKAGFALETFSSEQQLAAKEKLARFLRASPIPDNEILANLGLYTRSLMLAKTLYLNELYEHILTIPGIIMEFGTWWGATLALLASLRSVYEPYNFKRTVVGFDTFEGYPTIGPEDGDAPHISVGGYAVAPGWEESLNEIMTTHEQDNVVSHIKKYRIIRGNIIETLDQYLRENPETIISLAYFDLAMYEPTKRCLEAIRPYLVKGSVLAMDELNAHGSPGETIAFREAIGLGTHTIRKSRFLHDRCMVIID
jgi:Methyltransferase domain